jgi:hypothetical protein
VSPLAKRLAALATMSPAQLREAWSAAGDGEPPAVPADLLRRLLAQRLQEKRYGGLPVAVERELARVASGEVASFPRPAAVLRPGARLVREWQGRNIVVDVGEGDFIWEGRAYRSLSHIAREVTGAHWSGPRFFGTRARG